jgi:hypothetical protein
MTESSITITADCSDACQCISPAPQIIIKNDNPNPIRNRIFIGTPTLGIVRMEWAVARYSQLIPCNWSAGGAHAGYSHTFPMGYLVADAQNIIVDMAVRQNFEWIFLIEDDVIIPFDCFARINEYMRDGSIPVISGLYFLKSEPPEPLVYRGRGNGAFFDWKMGDKIWVDGVPTGCLLINGKVLKLMWDESPEYLTATGQAVKRVFETPSKVWLDPESGFVQSQAGTSDLYWCDRVRNEKVLQRSGFEDIGNKEFPYLVDTNLFCKHIDLSTGKQYPLLLDWKRTKM